eukprot:CAMPEP_0202852714 /NCGR_PEP_ID=MMETSP1389-20130828/89825_1 /ASSEMBLY_ACC=CAM_ASM_000865 /TAXON_ID=302021 /ORGANISM="Rhodomonas sp., Strain CCMP768" /LENGTH=71 /DNA_ID=CAMNT_0049531213 /DNA_START=104 /DNA_END=316 /DNA_ORIENTATION=+
MILGGMLACQEDVETNEETEPAPEVSSHAAAGYEKAPLASGSDPHDDRSISGIAVGTTPSPNTRTSLDLTS